jgi:hypothetical protein
MLDGSKMSYTACIRDGNGDEKNKRTVKDRYPSTAQWEERMHLFEDKTTSADVEFRIQCVPKAQVSTDESKNTILQRRPAAFKHNMHRREQMAKPRLTQKALRQHHKKRQHLPLFNKRRCSIETVRTSRC